MKTIVTFIIVFAIIVIVHEFGHFYFAKRSGILVREFAIGMGPKIFAHRGKDGTTYTIRILPIGGYVRMAGLGEGETPIHPGTPLTIELDENEVVQKINLSKKVQLTNGMPLEVIDLDLVDDLYIEGHLNGDESNRKRYPVLKTATVIEEDGTELLIAPREVQFQSAKISQRLMTNFAGPMNNFILGIVLFILLTFMNGGVMNLHTNEVGEIQKNSPAQKAGLKESDKILSIDGKKVSNWQDLTERVSPNPGKKLTFEIETKDNQKKELTITPEQNPATKEKDGLIGIRPTIDHSIPAMLLGGFKDALDGSIMIFKAIGGLFSGFSLNKLGGPVMIFEMSRQASENGLKTVIAMMAMLSMNLGIMNLLPIPALDGGKIVLNLIEAIRKKPMSQEKEGIITLIGVGFLVLLMILVTWNDISRFFLK